MPPAMAATDERVFVRAGASEETRRAFRRALGVLAFSQVVGWGTTLYLPAILSEDIARGTGLSPELVFGGVTLMLLVSGALGPTAGRLLQRHGARPCLVAGSLLVALGLVALASAHGPFLFTLAWIVIGVGTPFALMQAPSTAMVQIAPDRARRAIAIMFLFSGMSSTASWPVLIWMDGRFGWRGSLVVYAAVHALVCASLHLWGIPSRSRGTAAAPASTGSAEDPAPPPKAVPGAFPLAALSL
ncbi:MAG: MFS transporter, partial [Methylobacteriaceae bacterium]|nr:MFS transporter [Methylobacteriaceae bacterium]